MALAIVGWIGVRTIALWPVADALPDLVRAITPPAMAETMAARARPPSVMPDTSYFARAPTVTVSLKPHIAAVAAIVSVSPKGAPDPISAGFFAPGRVDFDLAPSTATPGSDAPPVFTASRLSGSAWAIIRPDGSATPFASQLGGSQAGIRLAYAVDSARRLAVTTRFSTALDTRQREAAIGLDWKPTRLPIHLVVEQRIAIEGTRGGPAIGAIGGVGPTPIGAGFRIEGYGQAGVIARDGAEGFADGSMRIARQISRSGRMTLDLGVGGWGGAQRGGARLDIGPSIGASLPVGRRSLRLTADWRQRVAGDARPGSGPALSIGTDF